MCRYIKIIFPLSYVHVFVSRERKKKGDKTLTILVWWPNEETNGSHPIYDNQWM